MKEVLSQNNVKFAYLDITESLVHLRNYLRYRDTHPAFDQVKDLPSIGIPVIVVDDGADVIFSFTEADLDRVR